MNFFKIITGITFLLTISVYFSCDNNEDRLDGYRVRDPIIGFGKYYLTYDSNYDLYVYTIKDIDSLSTKDTVFIGVTEFNRSDGKPCPAKGLELTILLKTESGDQEIYSLDSEINLWYPDNVTGYTKILPLKYSQYYPYNGMLEINPKGDKIYAEYYSWWNNHLATDKLYFQP